MKIKLQRLALPAIVCLAALNAHAGIDLTPSDLTSVPPQGGVIFRGEGFTVDKIGDPNPDIIEFDTDYSLKDYGRVVIVHRPFQTKLTVDNGSLLRSARGLYTFVADPMGKSEVYVDGAGSRIEIGSAITGTGNIILQGKGDFDITNGAAVNWTEPNNCNGGFEVCDILIGRSPVSNTGIRVIGAGSRLDNFNTGGRLFVGADFKPNGWSPAEVIEDTTNFLVAQDGGLIRSYGASVGKGFEGPAGAWDAETVGYVRGTALVDNGTWLSQSLNIGEGDGGSGNVFIVNGGIIDITTDQVDDDGIAEGGFYLGQTADGVPTEGGSNLLVVDGPGSTLNVDNNSGVVGASRIANGFVTVQNDGAIQLDSSFLLVSGKTAASLSIFNTTLADNVGITTDLSNINLDVLDGGSVTITDADSIGISALIIGQTPDAGPTQSATVRVSGLGSNITVMNDPGLPKLSLSATQFGIPSVSNIGTGSLTVEVGGSVIFDNGDFVVAARTGDDAEVLVDNSTLTADRVVVGWVDYVPGGASVGFSSGILELTDGVIEGDVVVDDNGILRGIGTINGTLFAEGGLIDPGFSPGTITVESLVLGAGSELVMEVGLNPDGSINAAASDSIVATDGALDLSAGEVTFELSSVDPDTSLAEILATADVLSVVQELFDSSDSSPVDINSFSIRLDFEKISCKKGGWETLYRTDESGFKNQGQCIRYVNTGN